MLLLVLRDLFWLCWTSFSRMTRLVTSVLKAGSSQPLPKNPQRRRFLLNATNTAIVAACAPLSLYGFYEARGLPRVKEVQVPVPGLPDSLNDFRIVQLSDLHIERLTRRERDLMALVAGLTPDLIVLTGDFLSTSYSSDQRALDDLRTLLAQLHAPGGVYAVWGTPEVDLPHVLRPVLGEEGIVVLEDEAVDLDLD